MIALLLLAVVGGLHRGSPKSRGLRVLIGALVFALVFLLAKKSDAVTTWGEFSGPYGCGFTALAAVTLAAFFFFSTRQSQPRPEPATGRGVRSRFLRHRAAVVALLLLAVLIEFALWAGAIEHALGVDHTLASTTNRFGPAGFPNLFGTDQLSRDVFTRLWFAGRVSLVVGIVSAVLAAVIGTAIGLFAGTRGGLVDSALMRLTDAMLSVPVLPLLIVTSALNLQVWAAKSGTGAGFFSALVIGVSIALIRLWSARAERVGAAAPNIGPNAKSPASGQTRGFLGAIGDGAIGFGMLFPLLWIFARLFASDTVASSQSASVVKIVLLIVAFGWMSTARLARAAALELNHRDFVVAARSLGASEARVILRHVLPNAAAPILVAATLDVGSNILYEAALSYLGLGVQPPVASWGNMLDHALVLVRTDPMLAFWPGAIILVTVASFNLVGDGLRDATDPHHDSSSRA